MANTAESMLDKCRSYIGYKEGPDNDTIFGAWYPMNHQPWCAMFISYCAAKTDNADIIPKYASCAVGVDWFRDRGKFDSTPTVGAIVFYGAGGGEHTEIVESFTSSSITTIGGNTNNDGSANGDGVYRRVVSRSSSRIYGYGHPDYTEGSDMPKRVSVARKAADTLVAGAWEIVSFDTEFADGGAMHPADGASFIQGPAHYLVTASARISGLAEGTTIQTRFVEVNGAGAGVVQKAGPIQEHLVTSGDTFITQSRNGAYCDDGNRVQWHIQVATGTADGTLAFSDL
ncbi:CHAP domain-containing protein, partial [Streptomyces indicus]